MTALYLYMLGVVIYFAYVALDKNSIEITGEFKSKKDAVILVGGTYLIILLYSLLWPLWLVVDVFVYIFSHIFHAS